MEKVIQDTTAPASITNLNNISGQSFINWTWTDPGDSDFDKVIIYFDGSWAANVSAGTQSYNASGLTASTSYEIATRTIDISGNINTTWVNDTATTAP